MSDDAAFVRDRLEIIDLIHRYAHRADAGDMAGFVELFDAAAVIDISVPGVHDKPSLTAAMERRPAQPDAGPTRHLMTNIVFDEQGGDAASGALYFTLMRTTSAGATPVVTGEYTFTVVRSEGGWRIRRWRAVMDAAAVQHTEGGAT